MRGGAGRLTWACCSLGRGTGLALSSILLCESWLCHFSAKGHWVTFLTTLSFSFFICKVGS